MAPGPLSLLRMSLWARRPASWTRVVLVLSVIALCAALALVEWWLGWPDWLTPNSVPRGRL